MRGFVKNLLNRFDGHMQELLRGSLIAFVLKILAAGFSFGLSVLLARQLGPEGSGTFFLALTVVLIIATFSRIGMDNVLVKFIAANIASEHPEKVLGVYRKAIFYTFIVSAILSFFLYLLVPWISQVVFSKPELTESLAIMAIAVVPMALFTLHAYALQGMKKIAESICVLSVVVPTLACLGSIIFVSDYGIEAIAWIYLFSTVIALVLGRWFWMQAIPRIKNYSAQFSNRELFATSIPLFIVAIANMIMVWSPMLFLGIWESSKNIGIYSAANSIAMLTSFVLIAVNSIAAPKFSSLYQQGDFKALGVVARNSSKIMILFASPVLLMFLLMPEWVLSIFGEEFKEGAAVLVILALGQFVNVATGSVGYLLMMSGNERLMRNNLLFCMSLGVGMSLWLVSGYGIVGAALSAAFMLSLQNIIAMIFVWKKLSIITLPWVDVYQR